MTLSWDSQRASGTWRRYGLMLAVATFATMLSVACGGGSGGSSTSTGTEVFGTQGIELPSEVSAVSSTTGVAGAEGIMSLLRPRAYGTMAAADLPDTSDYHTIIVRKFVEVRALEVFDILADIFDAVRQTHYEDHVGDGWYKCMVAFKDTGGDGANQTRLEDWYINSRMFDTGTGSENRVQIKMKSNNGPGGGAELIRVETIIREAPTRNSDDTLADMGDWEIKAIFSGTNYFHATASVLEGGESQVTLEESFTMEEGPGGGSIEEHTRAVIIRSATDGYGVVEYNDWQSCMGPCEGSPPTVEVSFAYNENYLTIQPAGGDSTSYDRNDDHELVHRYALFDSTTGTDIEKSKNFGFPVRTESGQHGWYGAWQDRHELWLDGQAATSGTSVTRDGLPPEQTPPTYTTKRFSGAMNRVDLVQGSMDQLDGVTAEIHIWNDYRLRWNAAETRWDLCVGFDGFGGCETESDFTSKLPVLQMPGEKDRFWVNVHGCNEGEPGQWSCTDYVYDTDGFYLATFGQNGPESTGTPLDTGSLSDGAELWASVGGQGYIEYTGEFSGPTSTTGWVQKTLLDFDQDTWTPSFSTTGDSEFQFEMGREYFVNQRGSNLRVTRVAENDNAADYAVYMEAHKVAKPVADLSAVIADGAQLVDGWDQEGSSKYVLNTTTTADNYLLLEYAVLSERDEGDGKSVGDVVTQDMWGLRVDGDESPISEAVLYNWEYQGENDGWGGVTYLVDGEGDYVLLDEPLRFEAIALASTDDLVQERAENEWISYALTFDGWLQGVPDPWFELQRIGFEGSDIPAVLAKNVRIPDGTLLTSSSDSTTYYIKAVDVGIFLGFVTAFPNGEQPSLSPAATIDLETDLPDFVAPTLDTTIPTDAELLYVEGIPVSTES